VERTWLSLDDARASTVEALCETIVPGSSRTEPAVYIDAKLAGLPEPARAELIGAIDALADVAEGGAEALAPRTQSPEFFMVRALATEAFYSDFVAPGAEGPGAYEEIDFRFPLASRIEKDWSYLGVSPPA
jgi:hypothetical protein